MNSVLLYKIIKKMSTHYWTVDVNLEVQNERKNNLMVSDISDLRFMSPIVLLLTLL